jgi:hypothetical protein
MFVEGRLTINRHDREVSEWPKVSKMKDNLESTKNDNTPIHLSLRWLWCFTSQTPTHNKI